MLNNHKIFMTPEACSLPPFTLLSESCWNFNLNKLFLHSNYKTDSDDSTPSICVPVSDNSVITFIPKWEFFKFY